MINDPQQPQQVPPAAPHPYMYQVPPEDEIDLLDLLRVLIRRWKMIALVTVLATGLAVAYALLAPRIYKTEAILLPPKASDVEPLNVVEWASADIVDKVSADDLYSQLIVNLKSTSLRKSFFREHGLLTVLAPGNDKDISEEVIFQNLFDNVLAVQSQNKKELNFFTVTLEGEDSEKIAPWLNDFIAQVNAYTVQGQVQAAEAKVVAQKKHTLNQIAGLRDVARDKRMDRIAVLEEAVFIARKLGFVARQQGIVEREYTGVAMSVDHGRDGGVGVAASTIANPIYLRGVRELQAEIDMLNSRKNDDSFIAELRQLQSKLAELDKVVLDPEKISAVRIDQPALVPEHPIKPKRQLIVALGLVIGLMGGIFLAFFMNFIESSKGKLLSKEA